MFSAALVGFLVGAVTAGFTWDVLKAISRWLVGTTLWKRFTIAMILLVLPRNERPRFIEEHLSEIDKTTAAEVNQRDLLLGALVVLTSTSRIFVRQAVESLFEPAVPQKFAVEGEEVLYSEPTHRAGAFRHLLLLGFVLIVIATPLLSGRIADRMRLAQDALIAEWDSWSPERQAVTEDFSESVALFWDEALLSAAKEPAVQELLESAESMPPIGPISIDEYVRELENQIATLSGTANRYVLIIAALLLFRWAGLAMQLARSLFGLGAYIYGLSPGILMMVIAAGVSIGGLPLISGMVAIVATLYWVAVTAHRYYSDLNHSYFAVTDRRVIVVQSFPSVVSL